MVSGKRLKWLKQKLFLFGSEQLDAMLTSEFLFVLAKAIELVQLQIIAFSVLNNMFPSEDAMTGLYTVASALNLRSTSNSDLIYQARRVGVITLVAVMSLLQLFLILKMPSTLTRYRPSYFVGLLFKVSAIYVFLFENILVMPFEAILVDIYFCNGFAQCFSTEHIVWLVLAVLTQLLLILTLLIDVFLAREDQPESAIPWTCFNSMVPYLRLLLKLTVSVLRTFGESWDILTELSIVVAVLSFFILVMRWRQGGEHRLWANCVSAFQEVFTLCTYTVVAFIFYANQSSVELFAGMALSPAFMFSFELARLWREERILKTSLPAQQQTINDVEIYIHRLLSYVRDPANSRNYMLLSSILVLHLETCENPDCVCAELKAFTLQRYNDGTASSADQSTGSLIVRKQSRVSTISAFMEAYNRIKDKWYRFIIILTQDALNKFQKVPTMHLQLSYLYLRLFQNCYMALYCVQNARMWRPSFALQFEIFHHTRKIESTLMFRVDKSMSSKHYVVNIEKNIKYLVQMNIFLETAESCAHDNQQFWKIVSEAEPDTGKLQLYGAQINQGIKRIRQVYEHIMSITQTNVEFLYKYRLFMKNVIHDEIEAYAIYMRILNSREIVTSTEKKWNCWESQCCVVRVSGDRKSLAQVRDVSLECEQFLGYSKKELVGTSLNKLMPPPIAKHHDDWIIHFYDTMVTKTLNSPVVTFIQKKSRHYAQCEILVCVVPSLESGIQEFVLFIKPSSRSHHIPTYLSRGEMQPAVLLCDEADHIIGTNELCDTYFGIPVEIADTAKNECSLLELFPKFVPTADKSVTLNDGIITQISVRKVKEKLPPELLEQAREDNCCSNAETQLQSAAFLPTDDLGNANFWIKLVEESYGEKAGCLAKMKIAYLLPLGRHEEELKALGSTDSRCRKTIRKEEDCGNPKAETSNRDNRGGRHEDKGEENGSSAYGSSYGSSNSSNSTGNSEARVIKEFKLKLYERRYPFTVKLLRRCMAVLAILLFVIECTMRGLQCGGSGELRDVEGGSERTGEQLRTHLAGRIPVLLAGDDLVPDPPSLRDSRVSPYPV